MKNINHYETIIIVPFYEDEVSLMYLLNDLRDIFYNNFYIVIIDDGSLNCAIDEKTIQSAQVNGCVIKLKRNVGHQQAIAIGMRHISKYISDNHKIVIMDCDGEDTPKAAKLLISKIKNKNIDIVVAKRDKRTETFLFKIFYLIYKFIFLFLTGKKIDFGNFLALKKNSLLSLILMPELSTHIAATTIASKLRIKKILINRSTRYAGKSKMNFFSLVLHGFRALMVFTEEVLVRVGITCIIIAFFSAIGSIIAITLKLFGFSSPGWFSIALGILLLIMLQTGALALSLLISAGKNIGENRINIRDNSDLVDKIFES